MRIQRFQIAHRAYTFTDAEDSADFNDIYLFGDQTGCFSLASVWLSRATCNIGNDMIVFL